MGSQPEADGKHKQQQQRVQRRLQCGNASHVLWWADICAPSCGCTKTTDDRRRLSRATGPIKEGKAEQEALFNLSSSLNKRLGQVLPTHSGRAWTMQDVRQVWPCLSKPAQHYIACFETLAQLALLQATHSHIGGGRYSFSMPSGTDNSAAEAGISKMFTTSWPLQIFVQLVASRAHAKNVLLQLTHLPGRCNEWADDLSRNRLGRFAHLPANHMRFSPASLAQDGRGIALCPAEAPWRPERVCAQTPSIRKMD